jgi:hypothetical protein
MLQQKMLVIKIDSIHVLFHEELQLPRKPRAAGTRESPQTPLSASQSKLQQ